MTTAQRVSLEMWIAFWAFLILGQLSDNIALQWLYLAGALVWMLLGHAQRGKAVEEERRAR